MNSNLDSKKGQKDLLEEVDSNSNKVCSDGWIRIFIKNIRIPSEKEVKLKAMDLNPRKMDSIPYEEYWKTNEEIEVRFESPTQQFESLNLELRITYDRFESSQEIFE